MSGPLAGVRVVDLTSVVMGPYATLMMAEMGAEVIKVEPLSGDTTRQIPPMRSARMGSTFLHLNRSKRSIALDLKAPEAREALLQLIETADVFISNVRPLGLGRLGLSPEQIAARNPRIIVASLVGFGQDGPYAADPAYDDLIQGLTAIPSMLATSSESAPHYVPLAFNDRAVGSNALAAILAALLARERTGKSASVEIPMFETMAHATLGEHLGGLSFEPPLGEPGYARVLTPGRRPYPTRDGHVCVIVYTDTHWRSFARLIGEPDLLERDPRFANISARTQNSHVGYSLIAQNMLTRTTAEWLETLKAADIPAAPLHTLHSIVGDPHLNAVGFYDIVEHPTEGLIRHLSPPTRWKDAERVEMAPAPHLGEHTREVLQAAGVANTQIEALLASRKALQA